jgi:hypothetical protein
MTLPRPRRRGYGRDRILPSGLQAILLHGHLQQQCGACAGLCCSQSTDLTDVIRRTYDLQEFLDAQDKTPGVNVGTAGPAA